MNFPWVTGSPKENDDSYYNCLPYLHNTTTDKLLTNELWLYTAAITSCSKQPNILPISSNGYSI